MQLACGAANLLVGIIGTLWLNVPGWLFNTVLHGTADLRLCRTVQVQGYHYPLTR
jgi:hypothetical protein